MEKRCTNSSCRRVFHSFRADSRNEPVCPYCGKRYPRAPKGQHSSNQYAVILTHVGTSKLGIIKAIRIRLGLSLRDAKMLVDQAPCLLENNIPLHHAHSWQKDIAYYSNGTGMVKIIPARKKVPL